MDLSKEEIRSRAHSLHQYQVIDYLFSSVPPPRRVQRVTPARQQFMDRRSAFCNGYGRCVSCSKWVDVKDRHNNPEIELGKNDWMYHSIRYCKGRGKQRRIRIKSRGRENRRLRDRVVKRIE